MTTLTRAVTAIRRKKIKTLIMFLIMSVIFSGIAGGVSVHKAMTLLKSKVDENVNSAVSLEGKNKAFLQQHADKLSKLENIKKYNYQYDKIAQTDKQPVTNKNKNVDIGNAANGQQNVGITGILNSAMYPQFANEAFELIKGRHINDKSKRTALVHEAFAKKNKLKPGSELKIGSGKNKMEVTVAGVYKGHSKTTGVLPEELVENNIFTDLKTAQSLVPGHKGAEISKAWYFTSSPKLVNSVIKEAKKQDLPWKTLRIRNENEASKGVVSSLENVQQIITMFMIGMGITAILILSFVLIFWIRNRINEIGILVSVGISKANVMKQMIWELLMIGAAALGAAFAVSKLIAGQLGSIFIKLAGSGNDGISSKNLMHSALNLSEYAVLCLLGGAVILISVSIAYAPIASQKPKEILSKMN